MNPGLLPGFGRKVLRQRRVVGLLRSVTREIPAGYGNALAGAAGAVIVDSGAVTASVRTQYLRINGAGRINWLSFHTNNATSRNVRVWLKLDDLDVIDVETTGLAQSGVGRVLLGTGDGANIAGYSPLEFGGSLEIHASCNLSETNGFRLAYAIDLLE